MLTIGMYMTISTLYKQGKSLREIARVTGIDRKTVRRIVEEQNAESDVRMATKGKKASSKVEQYKDKIIEYLEKDLSGVRIYEELKLVGMSMSYSALSRYIARINGKKDICVRFHTDAGEEAQVDFGYIGMVPSPDGKKKKAWVFNMRLSYSRLDYYEVVFDQKVETFIMCHINGFRYFGGVPKTVKVDNLKSAILEANFYEPLHQQIYKQFADYHGCMIIPCRVRQPQEKGKVEAGIKYIKNNFFAGREFKDYKTLQEALRNWLDNKCNNRVHGTTRKVPRELFESEERSALLFLPIRSFIFPEIMRRKVYKDCHIMVAQNYYSVPYEYVGKTVDVERDDQLVRIVYEGKQVAVHTRDNSSGKFITNESHYPKYKNFTPKSELYREDYSKRMSEIGISASKLFRIILEQESYSWYRTVSGILSLKKLYSNEVIKLSCKRALSFGIVGYRKIKNICESGSYNLPLEEEDNSDGLRASNNYDYYANSNDNPQKDKDIARKSYQIVEKIKEVVNGSC